MKSISQLQAIVNQISDKYNGIDTIAKLNQALGDVSYYSDCMLDILRDALRLKHINDSSDAIDNFISKIRS